jgi:plasmid stabilization system protein ParE
VKVVFRAATQREIEDGAAWYEAQVRGLGLEFTEAVNAKVLLIAKTPELFQIAEHRTRRAILSRFPYTIFYRIAQNRIVIVAVFHSARKPIVWLRKR